MKSSKGITVTSRTWTLFRVSYLLLCWVKYLTIYDLIVSWQSKSLMMVPVSYMALK